LNPHWETRDPNCKHDKKLGGSGFKPLGPCTCPYNYYSAQLTSLQHKAECGCCNIVFSFSYHVSVPSCMDQSWVPLQCNPYLAVLLCFLNPKEGRVQERHSCDFLISEEGAGTPVRTAQRSQATSVTWVVVESERTQLPSEGRTAKPRLL